MYFATVKMPADGVHHRANNVVIMARIWRALDAKPRRWRVIFKGLTLLEYLLKNGDEEVVRHFLSWVEFNFSWAVL